MTETPKPSRRGTFFWNAAFSILGLVLALISTFILIPLYLKYIDSKVYGAWLASGNIISWLGMVDPGLSLVVQQKVAYAYGARDNRSLGEWIGAGLLINGIVCCALAASGLAIAIIIPSLLKLPENLPVYDLQVSFAWAVVGTAISVFSFGTTSINTGLQGVWGAGAINIVSQVVRIVTIWMLLRSGCGLQSIGIAGMVSGAVAASLSGLLLWRQLQRERIEVVLSLSSVRKLIGFLSFTSLLRIGHTASQYLDLFVVARVLGPENVTILRLSRSAAEMCGTFIQRPAAAIQSPLTHLLGEGAVPRAKEICLRFISLEMWGVIYSAGGLLFFNNWFMKHWVGGELYGGDLLNAALVAGFALNAIVMVLFNLSFAAGGIRDSSLVFLLNGLLYVALLYVLTPGWGLIGVACAGLLSSLLVPAIHFPRACARLYRFGAPEMRAVLFAVLGGGIALGASGAIIVLLRLNGGSLLHGISGLVAYSLAFFGALSIVSASFRAEMRSAAMVLGKIRL